MGKAKQEHRKRVAKRNEKIAHAKRSYEKQIDMLRKAMSEGMFRQNAITEISEEQASAELIEETTISETEELTETNIAPDEQSETKSE